MEDGGVTGVVVELTVPGLTGQTVGRPRAPAVSTGAVTGPALVELRSVVREVAGGAAQAAAAGHQVGLPVAGETVISPTLVTAGPAPLTLPAARVEPVARAALLHTDSRLAQNSQTLPSLEAAVSSYLQEISRLTGVAVPAVTGLAGVGAADTGFSLPRYEGA